MQSESFQVEGYVGAMFTGLAFRPRALTLDFPVEICVLHSSGCEGRILKAIFK
jgi:hypothetical protein